MKSFGNIAKDGQVRAVASGALTDGKAVIVNSDGTVSVVAGSAQAIGTPVVFETGSTNYTATTFDSNLNKIVIAYQDLANSNYGTAVVGTVSGVSISFGTPVVFESARAEYISATFDSNANKAVIAYADNGDSAKGTAIVGTVSGTSISFGSPTVFDSDYLEHGSCTFDTNSNKVVMAYKVDLGGGTKYGRSVVGTVSGTSISFGSPVIFENADSIYISTTFDSSNNKVVIAYRDQGNSNYGTAIVGTVSGTSISFGSASVFESGSSGYISITFDSNANKVVIAYQDGSNSSYGTAVVGTVSGTSISFGTPQVFNSTSTFYTSATFDTNQNKALISFSNANSTGDIAPATVSGTSLTFDSFVTFESAQTEWISSTFDTNQNSFVAAYRDGGNSDRGTGNAVQVGSTNITSENFIGFSDGAFANTDSAAINTTNTIDRNQSGLTAGQTYFVQTDGTLGLTAADPSVTAGTAISATELIVKG